MKSVEVNKVRPVYAIVHRESGSLYAITSTREESREEKQSLYNPQDYRIVQMQPSKFVR